MQDDPFDILGIGRDVDAATAKRAYVRLVKAHPPETDPEGFQRVRGAWEAVQRELAQGASPPPSAVRVVVDDGLPDRRSPRPPPPIPEVFQTFLSRHGETLSDVQRSHFDEGSDARDLMLVALQLEQEGRPKEASELAVAVVAACEQAQAEVPIGDVLALVVRLERRRSTAAATALFARVTSLSKEIESGRGDAELRRLAFMRFRYLSVYFESLCKLPYTVLDEVIALAASPFTYRIEELQRTVALLPRAAIRQYRVLQRSEPSLFPPVGPGWLVRFSYNPDDSALGRGLGCLVAIGVALIYVAIRVFISSIFK